MEKESEMPGNDTPNDTLFYPYTHGLFAAPGGHVSQNTKMGWVCMYTCLY